MLDKLLADVVIAASVARDQDVEIAHGFAAPSQRPRWRDLLYFGAVAAGAIAIPVIRVRISGSDECFGDIDNLQSPRLKCRRIVAEQRPTNNLDGRETLLHEPVVEFLKSELIALLLAIVFPQLQDLQLA